MKICAPPDAEDQTASAAGIYPHAGIHQLPQRHREVIRYKIGVKDEKVIAAEFKLIGDTGAYGTHGLTVNMVGGFKGLTLYNPPNSALCDVVYTNTPPCRRFPRIRCDAGEYAIEVLMEEIAEKLGLDVVEFKRKNWLKVGEEMNLPRKLGEGAKGMNRP